MSSKPVVLVIGQSGQVAQALVEVGADSPFEIVARGRPELDLNKEADIVSAIKEIRPDCVVNAAAYTAVDQAESEEATALALNAIGPGLLARASAAHDIPLIHVSTDYVFDGTKAEPYSEADPVAPLGAYGRTKLAGEQAVAGGNAKHVILRTAWVYSPFGKNFVKTMLRVGDQRDELTVVDDQVGNPTSAHDIAAGILRVADRMIATGDDSLSGIYHMTGSGEGSWADFAVAIFADSKALGGPHASVKRITTDEYPTPAKRPANSRLSCAKFADTFGGALPNWRTSAAKIVERLVTSKGWDS